MLKEILKFEASVFNLELDSNFTNSRLDSLVSGGADLLASSGSDEVMA